jgi:hypothetical protein
VSRRKPRREAEPMPLVDLDLEEEAALWEAEGARCAIEGMDLPDGAYFAMMEDVGLDPC